MRKLALALVVLAACGTSKGSSSTSVPSTSVQTEASAQRLAEIAAVQSKLDAVEDLDAAGFAAKYALPFTTSLGYEPLTAGGYDLVKKSSFAPNASEEAALAKDGFVMTDRTRFPSFVYGYQAVYSEDLPVFVSADSILFAVHKSFEMILAQIEGNTLTPALTTLIDGMRVSLAAGAAKDLSANAVTDVDMYLAVAASLLKGELVAPVAGGDAAQVKDLFDRAAKSEGTGIVTLFGSPHELDFSQFKPRGHYANTPELGRYFQATMWFGRIDLRMIETKADHTQVFRRRELEGAFALRAAMTADGLAQWKTIDDIIGGLIGEHDSMTVPQLDSLLADLKITKASELASKSDAEIAGAIVAGNYGGQRVASQLMEAGLGTGAMPLAYAFLLLGQRYTLDSHVFSNVVYDRVHRGDRKRMMPDPLDIAFAALGNDHAGLLLGDELATYKHAPDLASMRVLADEHPAEYWDANLYNEWMSLQRSLSPSASVVANPSAAGMPKVTGTEAWGRRILQTQLASWAELRHDTLLYVKQSYSGRSSCMYPDAYVDPYPEFFARLSSFAAKGAALTANLTAPKYTPNYADYFTQLQKVAATLEAMAKNQRTGAPHTSEQLAFINEMVFSFGCGSIESYDGWYAKLFYEPRTTTEQDLIVADVHTQPSDEFGMEVGRVLHVGTWMPRTMVLTIESCSGPRAYVGLVSSYHERITEGYQRLNDEEWSQLGPTGWVTPPEVPWLSGLVAR